MTKGKSADQSLAEVMAFPNIDNRPSIFSDLKDLIVTDDEFGIVEQQLTLTVRFNRPDDQSWVRARTALPDVSGAPGGYDDAGEHHVAGTAVGWDARYASRYRPPSPAK